ncbi:MAG: FliA/WhiG family RNA polymerase sigma factor [Oscillospiraceae bacterium]|nr:FliA/WhiG family RNA polymerase sigma factor [Oscillospiraceae bacterium]
MSIDAKTSQQLWKQYTQDRDPAIRETLICEHAHLIKYVAGRLNIYLGTNIDYEDLVSFGVFGLIDAIDKFDPAKGVKFETYASLRIRGAIIDNIREMDWAPRSLRQKGKDLEKLYAELENELGRTATDQEAADKMGVSIVEFGKFVNEASISSLVSLEEMTEQNYDLGDLPWLEDSREDPEAQAEFSEMKDILAAEIEKLSERERMVITLYYYEEMTLKEISKIMSVSESRISQLHTKAVAKLRGKLARHGAFFR